MRKRTLKPSTVKDIRRAGRANLGGVLGIEEMRMLLANMPAEPHQTASDSVRATIASESNTGKGSSDEVSNPLLSGLEGFQ
jgi:hypothetical protein